jgi:hypothetical protein
VSPIFGGTPAPFPGGSAGFDGNDYRKRVLAAIESRGGIQTSDPFEWYDVPLEKAEALKDRVVTDQIAAVWAFWQKQRDHPKYRGLVTALLAVHPQAAADLGEREARRRLATQVRAARAERNEDRFAELDGAIERLVERFGGIPRSKVEGLHAFAQQSGTLDQAAVEARIARHDLVDDEPAAARPAVPAVSPAVYHQVRADLDELGRILGTPPPVSLYDLLGLDPGAPRPLVAGERESAAARNRELRPDRRRALVDDLLAAVTTLLIENDPEIYLDALAEEVTERLRPRVSAAVLVEDELTAADHGHLLSEAEALGLDHARAVRVLSALAREHGVRAPAVDSSARPAGTSGPAHRSQTPSSTPASGGAGSATAAHETLSQARAALRAGRVLAARTLLEQARHLAGGTLPPIRAVSDEVDAVLAEAQQRWRVGLHALTARRFTEAVQALERLVAIAADVPGPAGQSAEAVLAEARRGTEAATAALAATASLTGATREQALLDALRNAPDHPGLLAALEAVGVQPVTNVRVQVNGRFVVITWNRSASPGTVDYRVEHRDAGGARRTFGTTQGLELEAALPQDAGPNSRYAVVARRAGISSVEVLSAAPGPANSHRAQPVPVLLPDGVGPPPAVPTLTVLPHGRRLRLVYPAPEQGRAEVRRLPAGVNPPRPGSVLADPAACGELVPGMGPGLAVDRRPDTSTGYVVLTVGPGTTGATTVTVVGAAAWYVALAPVSGLHRSDGRLLWEWPAGCTEVVVTWRPDAAPERADDPAATSRKVTNTRYQIDGGVLLPESALHVAVFAATRVNGTLVLATDAPAGARLLPDLL